MRDSGGIGLFALPQGSRPPPPNQRHLVIVGLEPASTGWVYEVLAAACRRPRRQTGGRRRRVFRTNAGRPHSYRAALNRVRNRAGGDFVIGEFGPWLWQFEGCDLAYLQPGLLILADILPAINRARSPAGAAATLAAIDHQLSAFPSISLETLFFEPHKLGVFLAERFGIELDLREFPNGREGRYEDALRAMLRLVDHGPFSDNPAMRFSPGPTYAVTEHGPGVLALAGGWSRPEREHTWSNGPRASLSIPLAAARSAQLRLHLDGFLAHGVSLRIFADGRPALEIDAEQPWPAGEAISFALPDRADPDRIVSIDLEFANTYCPQDLGQGSDPRQLGLALRAFAISDEAPLTGSLRSLIRWRRPTRTLALAPAAPGRAPDLGVTLTEAGLSGTLVTLTGGGLGNGDRIENDRGASLRHVAFGGTLAQCLAEPAAGRGSLDLVVIATAELFGSVLDALAPQDAPAPVGLPDLAVCAEDPGFFFERSLYRLGDRYWRIIARYGAVAVDPGLVSFTGRTG